MTVDTGVKVVESEKCGHLHSLSMTTVNVDSDGNDDVVGVCNGHVKDNNVFVDDCDGESLSDHGKNHDVVESDRLENESDVGEQSEGDVEENGEVKPESEVIVESENFVSDSIVEGEVDESVDEEASDLDPENGCCDCKFEDEVDKSVDGEEASDVEHVVDAVKEGDVVMESVVNDAKEGGVTEPVVSEVKESSDQESVGEVIETSDNDNASVNGIASPEVCALQSEIGEQAGSFDVVDNEVSSEDFSSEETVSVEDTTNGLKLHSTDDVTMDADQNDLGEIHSGDFVPENKIVLSSNESSEDAGSSLISVDECSCLDSVDLPAPCDSDVSSVTDNSSSGSTDDTCSQTKSENSKFSTQTVVSENDGTFGHMISFGSFGCESPFTLGDINVQTVALNNPAAVSASSYDYEHHPTNDTDLSNSWPDQLQQINDIAASSVEGTEAGFSDGHNSNPDLARMSVYRLVRIPRADLGSCHEQLTQCQIDLAEKTKARNASQVESKKQKAYCRELKNNLEAAIFEVRAARELVRAKRREMVRRVRTLTQQRQQLAADPQKQQEIILARNQRDHTVEQLNVLKKELDALKVNVSKADKRVKDAQTKHSDETKLLTDLNHQQKSAEEICQEAYAAVQSQKKRMYQMNSNFYQFKDDWTAATNYAADGKWDILERHCTNQVETVMELWNTNDEFRNGYIQSNMNRRLHRFGALDGTQLGVNEVKPILENAPGNRVNTSAKVDSSTTALTVERDLPLEGKASEIKWPETVEHKKAETVAPVARKSESKSKNSLPEASSSIQIEEDKEPKQTKEEELARKAEELRREEEAARLREQHRLEEKAKAEEALERKRRYELKGKAKAEFKDQKEAERKEKEKEKRAKKKERKRGVNLVIIENDPAQPAEPLQGAVNEPEVAENPDIPSTSKRPPKVSLRTKQIKSIRPIPPALRKKRKGGFLRYWPHVCIALLAIVIIFFLGSLDIPTIMRFITVFLHRSA